MKEIHKDLIKMMKEIDSIFIKNNIPYSIGCGTALGQVRSGQIIEWDDDIDLLVDNEDYAKAMEILQKQLPTEFKLQYITTDKKHHMAMAKVFYLSKEYKVPEKEFRDEDLTNKLSIDIFRVVRTNAKKRPRSFGFWTMYLYIRNANYGKLINFLKFPLYIIPTKFLLWKRAKMISKLEDKNGERFIMDEGINPNAYPYLSTKDTKRVQLNGLDVNLFTDSNKYLSNHYGPNYMTPKKYNHGIEE